MNAAAEIEEIAHVREARGELLALRGTGLEDFFDLGGNAAELFDELDRAFGIESSAKLAQLERKQKKRGELCCESLCRGNADLGARVGVDGSVGFTGYHSSDDVADGHCFRSERDHLALSSERVSGFSGLGMSNPRALRSGIGLR